MTAVMRKAIEAPIFSKEVLPKVPMSVFEGNEIYKELSSIIKFYYQGNSNRLSEEALLTLTVDKLDRMKKPPEAQQEYFEKIHELYDIRDSSDDSVIDEKIEEYIKKHMFMDLLKKAAININNLDQMAKISEEMRKIELMDVSSKQSEIINVLSDTEYVYQQLVTLSQNIISTGFTDIDALNGGGLAKGELGMVVAASGTGKTMVLTNLTANYVKRGYNVLFIALEELANRMILKFHQTVFGLAKSQILTGGIVNREVIYKTHEMYKANDGQLGKLLFSRFPPSTVTPAKIEQLIANSILREGVNVDVVIIDYPELLRNPQATGNEAGDGGKLFEEMRRIGQEYNVVMWTAAQMNRSAYGALIRTAEHMEGSLRKKNTAELIFTVNQSKQEYDAGFIRLYADKVRNPPEGAYNKMIGLKVEGSKNKIRDCTEEERKEHRVILEEVDNEMEKSFKGKRKDRDSPSTPDYANEINNSIQRMRG
jgi:RecA/RadA recombinase